MSQNKEASSELLSFGFNQDAGCFSCGLNSGFRVYNCDPFRETIRREFSNGGIGIVEMLFRTNIMAIVGGGPSPRYPPNKVMIWDDHAARCIGELSFRSQVLAVKLRKERIGLALEHKVLVYHFADLRLMHSIETLSNPGGLLALSAAPDHTVLACPGLHAGQVRVELYDVRRTKFIAAHASGLAALALSLDGKLLATASVRGTLVRIHSTADGTKLRELRRGAEAACIYSVAFSRSPTPDWVAITSDRGTIHVFSLGLGDRPQLQQQSAAKNGTAAGAGTSNPISSFSFVSNLIPVPYFASERSFAQFRLPEDSRSVVAFGTSPTTLLVVSASGAFYTASFDPEKGGRCVQRSLSRFIELDAVNE